MQDQRSLTVGTPSRTVSLPWKAATIRISNPTLATVIVRTMGLDVPTINNADLVVGPQTTEQTAVNSVDFAYAFYDPSSIVAGTPGTAQVTLLSKDEQPASIGSITASSRMARLAYYDRNAAAYAVGNGQSFAGGASSLNLAQIIDRSGRGGPILVEFASLMVTRTAAATGIGGVNMYIVMHDGLGNNYTLGIIRFYKNVLGDQSVLTLPSFFLEWGKSCDIVFLNSADTGGTVVVDWSAKWTVFDP